VSEFIVDELRCPSCGQFTCTFSEHDGRSYGGYKVGDPKAIPPGESFQCDDTVSCGFYVEINRRGVLLKMFASSDESTAQPINCGQQPV